MRSDAVHAEGGYRDPGWPEDYDLILPGTAPPGIRIVFEWVFPDKAVRDAEYHLIDGEEVLINQGIAGYHYGRMRSTGCPTSGTACDPSRS